MRHCTEDDDAESYSEALRWAKHDEMWEEFERQGSTTDDCDWFFLFFLQNNSETTCYYAAFRPWVYFSRSTTDWSTLYNLVCIVRWYNTLPLCT